MKTITGGIVAAVITLALVMGATTVMPARAASSIMCDNGVVEIGDFFQTVQDKCGEPDKKEGKFWRYDFGPSEPVYTVEFDENGKVIKIMEDKNGGQ